jgi:hypothetical protein
MIDNQREHYYNRMQTAQLELFKLVRFMRKADSTWTHAPSIGTRTPAMVSRKKK